MTSWSLQNKHFWHHDVMISSQFLGSKRRRVFTLGDGCWLPKTGSILSKKHIEKHLQNKQHHFVPQKRSKKARQQLANKKIQNKTDSIPSFRRGPQKNRATKKMTHQNEKRPAHYSAICPHDFRNCTQRLISPFSGGLWLNGVWGCDQQVREQLAIFTSRN